MNTPIPFPSLRLELQQIPSNPPGIEPLNIPVEWMRYCEVCDAEQTFLARSRCSVGLIARCTKCGDERLAPYTRTNSQPERESLI